MTEIFDFKDLGTYLHSKFIFQAENWQFASGISVYGSTSCTVTPPITLVIDGVGKYQISIITAKYAWARFISIPYICILVLQSGLSRCLMPWPPLTPGSHVGLDSVQTTTTP